MTREDFTTFVKGEQEQLRRFLLALCCGNKSEADDIAQESLVKAYLSSNDMHNKPKVTSWLYKIAYHTFIDHRRGYRSHQPLEQVQATADAEMSADGSFRYQDLYEALDMLPPKERTSLLLHYIKGYSVKEIAQIMDSSEDAVKKQLSRGRDHLKTKMTR